MEIPAVGVSSVRKSSFRLVFESTARRALRPGELVCLGLGLVVEERGEAWSVAGVVVDWGLKVDEDRGRVIDDVLGSSF